MVTAGPSFGSVFSNDATVGTIDWTNPSNVVSSNNVYATVVMPNFYDISHYLKITGFGFSIPAGSIILGIYAEVAAHCGPVADGTTMFYMVKLLKAGSIVGGYRGYGNILYDGLYDHFHPFGGATDLWDMAWSLADINAPNFGIVVSCQQQSNASRTAYIDGVTITVYYYPWVQVTDSGIATDAIQSVTASIPITETMTVIETILSPITPIVQDSGVATETPGIQAFIPVSDNGAGQEFPWIGIPIQDQGFLSSETVALAAEIPVEDDAFGVDTVQRQQNALTLDGSPFPHVASVRVIEPTGLSEFRPTGSPDLPRRKQMGKYGRIVVVTGRVDLSEVEALKALADGLDHFLMLPTGDSFYCHVNPIIVKYRAETLSDLEYSIELLERIDL